MIKRVIFEATPPQAANKMECKELAIKASGYKNEEVKHVHFIRKSLDARSRHRAKYIFQADVYINEPFVIQPAVGSTYKMATAQSKKVIIVGAGPAGYFAALELLSLGFKPIIFDRGKDVQARRRDLRAIQQFSIVNPNSNYCFGEGGAGAYSDGKLYTRSTKRGSIEKSLKILVEHGANPDILVEAHPHIGSNKLPKIVANMRATIEVFGGEVHFNSWVNDYIIQNGKIKGVVVNGQDEVFADAVILATGHSARDVFYRLQALSVALEAKPFALGVRVEHPQALIDELQYHQAQRGDYLPAASYNLTCQSLGRGVFSFCMCPGGLIVPAATAPGELVVNGMSMSRRDSAYANSGIAVEVQLADLANYQQHGALAALAFQAAVEQKMFTSGNGSQQAPCQRLPDFVMGRLSATLNHTSYIPDVFAAPLHQLMPNFIVKRLQAAFVHFGKQMPGYFSEAGQIVAPESRTSSPVRLPRLAQTLQHPQIAGLYPCGEGAGYAGGILSAAMDGQRVAQAIGMAL